MRVSLFVAGALALAQAGCGPGIPDGPIQAAFDAKSADFVLKGGTGRIEGQAFLRRDYGRVVTAAGERVFLVPATPYTEERFAKLFGGERRSYYGNTVEDPPDAYYKYRRETKVDISGRFGFDKLVPGRYIVATRTFWTEPKSFFTHGAAMYDIVDVKAGETTTAIISGK